MQPIQPRVSERISIQWEGREAAEETDTLVLTFPTHYLDLRVYRHGHPEQGQIEWAQAGEVKQIDDGAETPSLEFIPLINSVPPPPSHIEKLPDQGSFRTLANGDVEERGKMYNPRTVRNEEYIEIWRRLGLQSTSGGTASHTPSLLVRRVHSGAEPGVQAYVGYIGQFALGIARIEGPEDNGGRFLAWREQYDFEEGEWRRVFSIGSKEELARYVPSARQFMLDESSSPKDGKIVVGGQDWVVLHSPDHE